MQITFISFKIRTHVTGAITHGYGTNVFIDAHTWPHDSNLVLNVLMELLKMREILSDMLYLQLDNTARENKKKYVLAFFALLVEEGIFSEVHVIDIVICGESLVMYTYMHRCN